MGEQSVSAMIPNFIAVVSGASLAKVLPVQPLGRPAKSAVRVTLRVVLRKKARRVKSGASDLIFEFGFMFIHVCQSTAA